MRHPFLALAAAAALAACAQSPGAIVPVSMPPGIYDHLSCAQARDRRAQVAAGLAAAESRQRGAVAGDAVGVFLIGVPVASLTGGDQAAIIATERGHLIALDARLMRC